MKIVAKIFTLLFTISANMFFSQAPQSIPYQAVVRNTDGSVLSNTPLTMTFKIHDVSATGTVVYEESHTTSSNAQGLVALNVGGGTPITGTFNTINWGNGAKLLHVLMNAGNGVIDLGTQQMMSVPYALYANDITLRVSLTGDSLFIGDQVSIVPGVSAANPPPLYTQGAGVNDIDGNFYPSIIINGQEWMQYNLRVTRYQNGDSIYNAENPALWSSINYGCWICATNESLYKSKYGYLYNWFAVNDNRGVCPLNWHVPSENDWNNLINFLDPIADGGYVQNIAGDKMYSLTDWMIPNINANNSSGFTAFPAGALSINNQIGDIGYQTYWWSSSQYSSTSAYERYLVGPYSNIHTGSTTLHQGNSIRCIKD